MRVPSQSIRFLNKFAFAAAGLSLALATASCSDKKKSPAAGPALDTEIAEPVIQGDQARITYKSAIPNATFQCRVDINGAPSPFQPCDADGLTLKLQPGTNYTVHVKAVGPGGLIDETPAVRSLTGPAGAGGQEPATRSARVVIANLDQIGSTGSADQSGVITTDRDEVTLKLALEPSQAGVEVRAEEYRFECRRDQEQAFRQCDVNSKDSVTVRLPRNAVYTLAIRAVHEASGAATREEVVQLRFAQASISLTDRTALSIRSGRIATSVSVNGAAGAEIVCTISQTAPSQGAQQGGQQGGQAGQSGQGSLGPVVSQNLCPGGQLSVDLSSLPPGSSVLRIEARRPGAPIESAPIGSITETICHQTCQIANAPLLGPVLQVGSFLNFRVPDGMHVTQWATTKITNGVLFTQVSAASDRGYSEINRCDLPRFHLPGQFRTNTNLIYDYCRSSEPRDLYKRGSDFRFANNHIEVQTTLPPGFSMSDTGLPLQYERLLIQAFDRDFEYMNARSRFMNLCQNMPLEPAVVVPMLNRFFLGQLPDPVVFHQCSTYIPNPLTGAPELWRVGGFFQVEGAAVDLGCGGCTYPNAMEMVYMTRDIVSAPTPWDFARVAQDRLLRYLNAQTPFGGR